ncbi:hypothetical protein [Amycolatopsis vancoresmycina]|uniref:MucB/RseB N-terminal domain-containing protein n=1 Tax=Amycolatopsis vancoresmycina DSM 44592 TaxID=1292037 RepID=R1HUK9_9PSEU|nr:hypothetical protein [Amycolatopsis vancoresmycina]EOD67255.1 hypothetical protein H480_17430 [Amycolatopsis vancoresmycina DSM 44592]
MTPSPARWEKRRRWAVVATLAVLLVSSPSILTALAPAGAATDPGKLRALVLDSAGKPYQGYAESVGSLALPELPNLGAVTALFSMRTPMRVWYAGPDRYRVDILGTAGEHDVYRLPDGEYTWDYGDNTLTELIGDPGVRLPRGGDLLPPELARRVLRAARGDPVSALPGRNVAGVAAAGFRVVPADPDTTIGRVDVWTDPATGVAVRVELTARGQETPILVTEFQQLDQATPVVEAPRPVLGSGFTVASAPDVADTLGAYSQVPLPARLAGRSVTSSDFGGVQGAALYGSGLASFVVIAVPRTVANAASDAAGKAGAVQAKLAAGSVVQLSITPLSLGIVRSSVSRRSYLLAGTVTPAVLKSVADELSRLRRSGP